MAYKLNVIMWCGGLMRSDSVRELLVRGFSDFRSVLRGNVGFEETYSYRRNNSNVRSLAYNLVKNRGKVFNALRVHVYTAMLLPIATGVSSTYGSIYVVNWLGISKVELGGITASPSLPA
jgi:hypothetical protein